MQRSRIPIRRIPPLYRPWRLPSALHQYPTPRLFTHNSQRLLVVSPSVPRPQLPFLHPASNGFRYRTRSGQWQLARLLTTERKKYIKEQVWLAGRWTIFLWTSYGLLLIAAWGLQNEILERKTPSPHEWSFFSRFMYRNSRAEEDPNYLPTGMTDWASCGSAYRNLLERLEDPNIDGEGLKEQEEGEIVVPSPGMAGNDIQTGYDIQAKSEPWRRGYHDALMGCAKAAERLDGWVTDTTRSISFPPEVVIGPSNPNPRPCPPYAHAAPLEENCVPAYEPAEMYYTKILTTKGFNSRQRLQAALAYADWLDFRGLPESADEMYKWAFDLATSGVPDAEQIVDTKTGIVREGASRVSPNIIQAATSLATHYARNANVSSALPIYLSVLRARRSAPPPPYSATAPSDSEDGFISKVVSFMKPPQYPPPPPSGDEPLMRTPGSLCDDAELMTYIGEILFATSPSSLDAGLAWTRDAIADSEAGIASSNLSKEEKARCVQCLEVGLTNLEKMVAKLAREEKERKLQGKGKGSWIPWWGGSGKGEGKDEDDRWEREELEVRARIGRLHLDGLKERFSNGGILGGMWPSVPG